MSGRSLPTAAKVVAIVAVASLALGAALFVAATAYAAFGSGHADVNAETWALRPLRIAPAGCVACHPKQAAQQATNKHADIDCQTCHGPAGGHPGNDPNAVVAISKPTSAICVQCHTQVVGRPAGFAQIDLATHWGGGTLCLRCHDPHDVVAPVPPEIPHPLTDLPACTTCHRPDGLKPVPSGHTLVEDKVCLSCHKPLLSGR